jgi:hypothetical protein
MAELTEKEFKRHLNTKFQLNFQDHEPVDLELIEVKTYQGNDGDRTGMERFSLFFIGPPNLQLPQHIYPLQHAGMGECLVFLVPIGREERGLRYEAVFNSSSEREE